MSSTAPTANPGPGAMNQSVRPTGTAAASVPDLIDLSEPASAARPGEPEIVTSPVSAVLFGRHRILLDGLSMVLGQRPGIVLAGVSTDDGTLLELCQRERPDVAVLLLDADMNAEALVSALRRRHRTLRIVAVSTRRSWTNGNRLQALGAATVLPHGTELSELVGAITSDADISEVIAIGPRTPRQGTTVPLTGRELDVLRLVAAGMTTGEIGPRLGISPKTVENHKQRLFAKLGVQNQAHAVSIAMRAGLIDLRGQRLLADA